MNIIEEQSKKIHEIGHRYGLKLMLLYGSQARGQQRSDSDIDIAVLGQQPVELQEELSLLQERILFCKKSMITTIWIMSGYFDRLMKRLNNTAQYCKCVLEFIESQ